MVSIRWGPSSWKSKLITCVRTGQRCNKCPSNIHDSTFNKEVSNINLKNETIIANSLILVASLTSGRVFADGYIIVLKIQMELCKDGRRMKIRKYEWSMLIKLEWR